MTNLRDVQSCTCRTYDDMLDLAGVWRTPSYASTLFYRDKGACSQYAIAHYVTLLGYRSKSKSARIVSDRCCPLLYDAHDTHDTHDTHDDPCWFNPCKCFARMVEVMRFKTSVQHIDQPPAMRVYEHQPLVVFGAGVGARTAFESVCENVHDNSRVKLVILEAPTVPRDRDDVCCARLFSYTGSHYGTFKYTYKNTERLIDSAARFPREIPVALITSVRDTEAPASNVIDLYEALNSQIPGKVHLLVLHKSRHDLYTVDDARDRRRYLAFIHQLYKQYDLPYLARFAAHPAS